MYGGGYSDLVFLLQCRALLTEFSCGKLALIPLAFCRTPLALTTEFSYGKLGKSFYENHKNSCKYTKKATEPVETAVYNFPATKKMLSETSDGFAQFGMKPSEVSDTPAHIGNTPSEASDGFAQFGMKLSEASDASARLGIMPSEASDTSAQFGKRPSETSDGFARFGIMPSEPSDTSAQFRNTL
ncbi:MAG: hypothetical protein HDR37_02085, partial [Treponema sp.]|nr:hypothetical protein [Treponema sp.]